MKKDNHKKNIAAIIVTYNKYDYLRNTLDKTLILNFDRIIIVNNASSDKTKEYLNGISSPKVDVIHLDTNIGGAGGFHTGLKKVFSQPEIKYAVVYDDDAYPTEKFINEFKNIKIPKQAGAICSKVIDLKGNTLTYNQPRINILGKGFKQIFSIIGITRSHLSSYEQNNGKQLEVDLSTFVGTIFDIQKIKKHNILPKKELFIYGDDYFMSLELKKHQLKTYYYSNLVMAHDVDEKKAKSGVMVLWREYYSCRNGVLFYKNLSLPKATLLLSLRLLKRLFKVTKHDRKILYFKMVLSAHRDAFLNRYSPHDTVMRKYGKI